MSARFSSFEADGVITFAQTLSQHRDNIQRETTLADALRCQFGSRGFGTQDFRSKDSRTHRNFWIDTGSGDRQLVLIAHHDAVPGSPGANDNGASIGILLSLIPLVAPPSGWQIRFLFPAEEETGLQGTQAYVSEHEVSHVHGVLSLELCGIGDQIVVWDAEHAEDFLQIALDASHGIPFGQVPGFASDHRVFANKGIPAYGFSLVPSSGLEQLMAFVSRGGKGKPPSPFDTYHTAKDSPETLQAQAVSLAGGALAAIISSL